MTLEHATIETVEIIKLPNQLVMGNAPQARDEIKSLIRNGHTQLILDLQEISFIDSSGLSVLVSTLKAAQELQGHVVLLSPTDGVRSLIELTRLHHIFEIFEDKDTAVRSFH